LVLLSIAIAALAAFAALAVVDRMLASRSRGVRTTWLGFGALAMGAGIWAMHFTGMLALHLPIPVTYDLSVTLLSVVPAIVGSGVALRVMSQETLSHVRLQVGGLLMALGIGTMHYTGMEAVRVNATLTYDPRLFALSIVVAHVMATLALYVRFVAGQRATLASRLLGAAVMGGAVASMHYTAMAASRFGALYGSQPASDQLPAMLVAALISGFVAFILAVTIIGTMVDRKLMAVSDSLQASATRHSTVLQAMADGVVTFDAAGSIESVNEAAARLFALPAVELTGRSIDSVLPGCLARASSLSPTAAGATCEMALMRGNGRQAHVELVLTAMHLGTGVAYSAVARDVTERKEIEAARARQIVELETANRREAAQAEALRRQAEELVEARDRAEAGSRAKAEFLAAMSHEIRTPMNGVLGMTDILLDTPLAPDQREYAEIIRSSGQSLLDILNDVLDFSKIEAGRLDIEPIPFDLVSAVGDVVGLLSSSAAAKGLDLALKVTPDTPRNLVGDPGRVRQVVLNLVGNAIKFTECGHVRVTLSGVETGGQAEVRIAVSDTGIGIAPTVQGRLFAPFTQADSSTTRKYGGTGLGLAISQRLIDLMGGRIGVESVEGVGSTFWVTLTLPRAKPAAGPIAEPPPHASPPVPAGRRVLLAEDNPVNRIVAFRMLESLGFRVDGASNGLEAVDLWSRLPYDIVLMDCQMPELDGYGATQAIRSREEPGRRIPIVALTANAMSGDRELCMAAGMDDYLAKPLRRDELVATLARLALPLPEAGSAG
jgi:PAS domain S-box-containing protein